MSMVPEVDQRRQTDAERAAALRQLMEAGPPPMIAQSIAAFRRDLPKLLTTHSGRWVAYHGEERIGFGRTQTKLYRECLEGGLNRDEFVVTLVEAWVFDPDDQIELTYDDV